MTKEEAILQARRLDDRGEFKREIVARKLIDLDYDLASLKCGHTARMHRLRGSEDYDCSECAEQWINAKLEGSK